jgi:long-chain acyl-CoA synthetase
VETLARVFGYDADARFLNLLPTHHVDGLVHGVYASLMTGMTNVQPGLFTVDLDIAELLRRSGATHFVSNPNMLSIIRRSQGDRPDLFRTDTFRMLASSAGTLDAVFWKEFQDFFSIRLNNFYGLTETVSGSIYCGPADETFRLGTLGKPVDARAKLVDATGEDVGPGEPGELLIAGPHVMTGYLDDPEATAATLRDGWLATGDIFAVDTDGFFKMLGRSKNVIMRGGTTIHPEDIRRVMVEMPGVRAVEVLGVPDATVEEALVACVVAEKGVTVIDIRAYCAAELSVERRPDRVELFDMLPLGPAGKVRRDALIATIAERRAAAAVSADPIDLTASILTLAAETFQVSLSDLTLESSQETVDGWDSYSHMEFVLGLEQRFGIKLRAKEIMRLNSIGGTVELVIAHGVAPI